MKNLPSFQDDYHRYRFDGNKRLFRGGSKLTEPDSEPDSSEAHANIRRAPRVLLDSVGFSGMEEQGVDHSSILSHSRHRKCRSGPIDEKKHTSRRVFAGFGCRV
jgi:hypothetical protein